MNIPSDIHVVGCIFIDKNGGVGKGENHLQMIDFPTFATFDDRRIDGRTNYS